MFVVTSLFSLAFAGPPKPVAVTVTVVDAKGEPVPTAKVRHPDEEEGHRVNAETGVWSDSVLYLLTGELPFTKGLKLSFEVTAAGYGNRTVDWVVQKKAKKNVIVVPLERLEMKADEIDGPSIKFKHDNPRE